MRQQLLLAIYLLPFIGLLSAFGAPGAAEDITEEMRKMAAIARRVIARLGLSIDSAARYMGISGTLLSRQLELRGGAHVSFARLGNLPKPAHRLLAQELCDLDGQSRVVADESLDRVLRYLETKEQAERVSAERRRA